MNEIIQKAKKRLNAVLDNISMLSNCEKDRNAAEAAEHLARAIRYMYQIKAIEESEV